MSARQPPRLRDLLDAERHGVLATLSTRRDGWPFASATPYALLSSAEPVLLLSELAEHTRNARADPRASLLVQDSRAEDDPQAGARVTLLGRLEVADDADGRERYLARHPRAADYFGLGDFHLWALRVEEARFVNGFGDIGWLTDFRLRAALSE